jgi:hypothetical protein
MQQLAPSTNQGHSRAKKRERPVTDTILAQQSATELASLRSSDPLYVE